MIWAICDLRGSAADKLRNVGDLLKVADEVTSQIFDGPAVTE